MEQKFIIKNKNNKYERICLLKQKDFKKSKEYNEILKQFKTGQVEIFCACRNKDIEYKYSVDGKLYPAMHNSKSLHNRNCPGYSNFKEICLSNPAFRYETEDSDIIIANLLETHRNTKMVLNSSYSSAKIYNSEESMTLSAFYKKVNWYSWYQMAYAPCQYYLKFEEFQSYVVSMFKKIKIRNKRCTLDDINKGKNDINYFYWEYKDAEYNELYDNYKVCGINRYYKAINDVVARERNFSVSAEVLFCANEKFRKTYNGLTVENAQKAGYRIIVAGILSTKPYFKALDICFLLVNKYGLFVESTYEAKFFEYIIDYIENNHSKNKHVFFRPWSFGMSLYTDNHLEDAIIDLVEEDSSIVVECFGMDTEEYNLRKEKKEQTCNYRMLSWNASKKDKFPDIPF